MKYIYNKYHSKMYLDDYHTCSMIFIEENIMENFVNICDPSPDEYFAFFDNNKLIWNMNQKFIKIMMMLK